MPLLPRPLRSWGPVLFLSVVVVVSAVVVALGLRASPVSPSRPVLVSSGAWAPFVGPDLPDGGPVATLVTQTLNRAGYAPEVTYTSWSLAESQVASGASVGIFPMVGSQSRRERFLVSDPLIDFEYVLFYDRRKGPPRIGSAADLGALRVGGIAGYDYWPELEAAVGRFVEVGSSLEGFQALADGRLDVLAEGLLSGQAVLASASFAGDAADFDYLRDDNPLVRSVEGLYFMMADTAAAAEVMRRFNAALATMRRTDEYENIVSELTSSSYPVVTLTPVGRGGLVELLDGAGQPALLAPRGTRAQVLEWPAGLSDATKRSGPLLVKVKVVNGPAQGRVAYVDARSVLLEEGGS